MGDSTATTCGLLRKTFWNCLEYKTGDTSEASRCDKVPVIVSRTQLALDDEDLAPWVLAAPTTV